MVDGFKDQSPWGKVKLFEVFPEGRWLMAIEPSEPHPLLEGMRGDFQELYVFPYFASDFEIAERERLSKAFFANFSDVTIKGVGHATLLHVRKHLWPRQIPYSPYVIAYAPDNPILRVR